MKQINRHKKKGANFNFSTFYYKQSFLFIIMLLFLTKVNVGQNETYNINVPNSDIGGNLVFDIIEADEYIFSYSMNNILIHNADSNVLETKIPISNYGKFNPRVFAYNKHLSDFRSMTYNPNRNEVYYISPDLKLYYIDLDDNFATGLLLANTPAQISHFEKLTAAINLKFDSDHDRLYWVITGRDTVNDIGKFHMIDSYLAIYNLAPTGAPELNEIYTQFIQAIDNVSYYETFTDVVFCETNDYFFLAKKKKIERYEIDGSTVTYTSSCQTMPFKLNKMLYIKTLGMHKLLVFPHRLPYPDWEPPFDTLVDFYVIDCDNPVFNAGTVQTVLSPSKRVADAAFDVTNNQLLVCYSPDEYVQTTAGTDIAVYNYTDGTFSFMDAYITNGHTEHSDATTMNHSIKITQHSPGNFLISKKDELVHFHKNLSNTFSFDQLIDGISNYFYKGINYPDEGGSNKTFLMNGAAGKILIYNAGNIDEIKTAHPIYHTVSIPIPNSPKIVLFNRLNTHNTSFFIFDVNTETTVEVEGIEGAIGDIIYNPYTNQILVAESSALGKVSYYNILGQFLGEIQFPAGDVTYEFIRKLYITPDKELFMLTKMTKELSETNPRLLVYNAETYAYLNEEHEITMPVYNQNFHFYNAEFCYNKVNQHTYFTITPGPPYNNSNDTIAGSGTPDPYHSTKNGSKFLNYSGSENGYLIEYSPKSEAEKFTVLDTFKFPKEIIYTEQFSASETQNQGTLFINAEKLYRFDVENDSIFEIDIPLYNICYSPRNKLLFGLNDDYITPHSTNRIVQLYSVNLQGYVSDTLLTVPGQAASLFINPYNEFLYIQMKMDEEKMGNIPMQLIEIDPENIQGYKVIDLDHTSLYPQLDYNPDASAYYYNFTTPYIDSLNSKIYLPNGGHSNISVVEFEQRDFFELLEGITWLSYPRLPYQGYRADSLLVQLIDGNTDTIDMAHFQVNNTGTNGIMTYIDWIDGIWSYTYLNTVASTRGYKLTVKPDSLRQMVISGDVIDPATSMDLWANYDNWIGYFLGEPMRVEDAFEGYWDQIYSVKHQDWVIYGFQAPPPNPDGSMDFTLRYGDMVIVDMVNNISNFQWPSGKGAALKTVTEPDFFTYEEKLDYTSFTVELDPNNLPLEVGVYEDSTCMGASVVEDSIVQINGYISDTGSAITFNLEYGLKSDNKDRIETYKVYNNSLGKMESRSIHANEHEKFYWVSLKGDQEEYAETDISNEPELSVYPNPSSGIFNFDIELKNDAMIVLEIFNCSGDKVTILANGMQKAGYHKMQWGYNRNAGGIYYYRFSNGESVKNGKLVIIK
jgi:hypothetical protein